MQSTMCFDMVDDSIRWNGVLVEYKYLKYIAAIIGQWELHKDTYLLILSLDCQLDEFTALLLVTTDHNVPKVTECVLLCCDILLAGPRAELINNTNSPDIKLRIGLNCVATARYYEKGKFALPTFPPVFSLVGYEPQFFFPQKRKLHVSWKFD